MGYTSYSSTSRSIRAESSGYHTKSVNETFKSRKLQQSMNPARVGIRESRDSEAHPNSKAIIIALDVTGSMLSVPAQMVKNGLPTIMTTIIQAGFPDPQVMFLGIGDHVYDDAPLQISQFESGDEELDKWLTDVWLERGGGGNDGESYMLAHYFAAFHTSIDCMEKRKEKGILFTIGDENVLPAISHAALRSIFIEGQFQDWATKDLIAKAQENYHVYHIHTKETGAGSRPRTISNWKDILGQNVLVVENHEEIPQLIAETVLKHQIVHDSGVIEVEAEEVPKKEDISTDEDIQML